MADKERITQPSLGSNELGAETQETHPESGISVGTDTQLHLAALTGKKNKDINDDEKVVKNQDNENKFLQSDETDE